MEAAITEKSQPAPADLTKSNSSVDLRPEHIRLIALRAEGKRWSEIAAALGVTAWTIWNWRQENPEIDEIIAAESQDYLDATRHGIATLLPLSLEALRDVIQNADPRDRVAAVRVVFEAFKRAGDSSAAAAERMRGLARLPDGDLDAELAAVLAADKPSGSRR